VTGMLPVTVNGLLFYFMACVNRQKRAVTKNERKREWKIERRGVRKEER
jgi:hypothetical protein